MPNHDTCLFISILAIILFFYTIIPPTQPTIRVVLDNKIITSQTQATKHWCSNAIKKYDLNGVSCDTFNAIQFAKIGTGESLSNECNRICSYKSSCAFECHNSWIALDNLFYNIVKGYI